MGRQHGRSAYERRQQTTKDVEEGKLRELLHSPAFTGCKSKARRAKPGKFVFQDAFYWVILLTAYSGARREEICQLKVWHFKEEIDPKTGEVIWYIDLKATDLELKRPESARWVPLHRDVLALGFIEDRINGRAPSERVFSELSTSAADDKFGDALGKKFTEYRKNIGIYEELLDMHSFRHTVSTLLIRAGVPQAHAEEYVGHKSEARKTAFSIYDEGATIVILKEAIDKLVLPVDISLLLEAVKNSPTNVQGPPKKKASAPPLCKANQEPPAKLVV